MDDWSEEAEFEAELSSLTSTSQNKITNVAKMAVKNAKVLC